MQKYKIKRMSIKRINEWLEAIDALLRTYEIKANVRVCPFCCLISFGDCKNCIWYIIEEIGCNNFARTIDFRSAIDARNKKRWRKARIPMLKNWKKILKAELKRRGNE